MRGKKPLFGYDKHNKAIYNWSIIKFKEGGEIKIGNIWYYAYPGEPNPLVDVQAGQWMISYNHLGSERGGEVTKERKITNITVIGWGEDDEKMLERYCPGQYYIDENNVFYSRHKGPPRLIPHKRENESL